MSGPCRPLDPEALRPRLVGNKLCAADLHHASWMANASGLGIVASLQAVFGSKNWL